MVGRPAVTERVTVGVLVHPSMLINANDPHGGSYHPKAEKIADLRFLSSAKLGPLINPVRVRVRVTITYCFPGRQRRRDAANMAPSSKAIIDGLTDAGVWPDDNDKWVEGPDNRLGPKSRHATKAEVWITIEKAGQRWAPPAGMDRLV